MIDVSKNSQGGQQGFVPQGGNQGFNPQNVQGFNTQSSMPGNQPNYNGPSMNSAPGGRKYELLCPGAFPILKYYLAPGEEVKAESDAMVTMSPEIDLRGGVEGGIMKGIGRVFSGEKFFFQYLKAVRGPGFAMFAHTLPGDIIPLQLDGRTTYNIQKDGFLIGQSTVDISTKVQNLAKGLFNGGFFILKAGGTGTVFVSCYGSAFRIDLNPGEEVIVDNGHLIAWADSLRFKLEKASSRGWLSSFTSGEGLVCRFQGPGSVWVQTRNMPSFASWIRAHAPSGG